MGQFLVSSGTTPGRDHIGRGATYSPIPNQDGVWGVGRCGKLLVTDVLNNPDGVVDITEAEPLVLIATDGNGSNEHSQFGAAWGALNAPFILRETLLSAPPTTPESAIIVLEHLRLSLLSLLADEVKRLLRLDPDRSEDQEAFRAFVSERFLFTIVGCFITPQWTGIFSIGDGHYALNNDVVELGPFQYGEKKNAPPYLAYALTGRYSQRPELLKFQLHRFVPTSEVDSVMVGTDGLKEFRQAEGRKLPGLKRELPSLVSLWDCPSDDFLGGWGSLSGLLHSANREFPTIAYESGSPYMSFEHGFLKDDTTIAVARRPEFTGRRPSVVAAANVSATEDAASATGVTDSSGNSAVDEAPVSAPESQQTDSSAPAAQDSGPESPTSGESSDVS